MPIAGVCRCSSRAGLRAGLRARGGEAVQRVRRRRQARRRGAGPRGALPVGGAAVRRQGQRGRRDRRPHQGPQGRPGGKKMEMEMEIRGRDGCLETYSICTLQGAAVIW